jgi:outer membrane protein assembly factor BamB
LALNARWKHLLLSLSGTLMTLVPVQAQDWPQWRGPHRDGTIAAIALPDPWPQRLREAYRVEVGEGHAAPIVVGDRIYLFAREKDHEVIRCLEAGSGKELWKHAYPAPYKMDPAALGHGPGPKATPTFADGKLYTQGMSSQLYCLDAGTGKVLWHQDLLRKYDTPGPQFGTSTSLLVEGDEVWTFTGGRKQGAVIAFDRTTGREKWQTPCDGPAYCSPVAVELAGVRQVLTFSRAEFLSLSPRDGKVLWRIPYTTAYEQNIVTPMVFRDLVILSGYAKPTQAYRVSREGDRFTVKEAWKNDKLRMYMSSPVLDGDHLFGHDQSGQMVCLDAATGKTLWAKGNLGDYVSLILAGKQLLCLDDQAELTVLAASPAAYMELARLRVSDSPTWAHLALTPGRLYVKDKTRLIVYEMK